MGNPGKVVLAIWLVLSASTQAATTLFSNVNQPLAGEGNFLNTSYRYATDFKTDSFNATITGATLTLDNLDTGTNHTFTASIFTDNSGTPGTLVGSFNPLTVLSNTGNANYSTTSAGISLTANTIYWEVLQMNEADVSSGPQWADTGSQSTDAGSVYTTITATPLMFSSNGGASYSAVTAFGSPVTGNYQFALSGTETVPEPSPTLLGLAATGAMLLRRRRQP